MKKLLLLAFLAWGLSAPVGACGCAEMSRPKPKLPSEKLSIQVKHDTQKRREQAIFLRKDKSIAAIAHHVMPDFPNTKVQFFDKNKNKIAEISLSKQNRKQEYFTFFYPNGQKMFHESKQHRRQIWDKSGALIDEKDKKKSRQINDEMEKIGMQVSEPLHQVLRYLSYDGF